MSAVGVRQKRHVSFFVKAKESMTDEEIFTILEPNDISKLDINRIYRYLEKYVQEQNLKTKWKTLHLLSSQNY